MTKEELIEAVVQQIKDDLSVDNLEPLEILLANCTTEDLRAFLPEGVLQRLEA